MAPRITFEIVPLAAPLGADIAILVGQERLIGTAAREWLGESGLAAFERAATIERFKGKPKTGLTLMAPEGAGYERILAVGLAQEAARRPLVGGGLVARMKPGRVTSVIADLDGDGLPHEALADLILGMRLRAYKFDAYKSKPKDEEDGEAEADRDKPYAVRLHVADVAAGRKALKAAEALAGGVELARDFVNEPPNVLYPDAFARRIAALEKLGVEITVLDEKQLAKIGMRALLGVAQGSRHPARVVLMHWRGRSGKSDGKAGAKGRAGKAAPLAIIGKGVTFDTGGISIKPAAGMEDMKGDMAGAACVVGLMHALAARKAKADVIGAVGLVENMPDGAAQRPGDIVTSLSGQTIEIINTDAEGRLVLADVLWHVKETFKPAAMIDLATLTGAILVALAKEHAGLFSNDDDLAARLSTAGEATGETVWRMPLGKAYDKMIDSKFADMKNTGGRNGGSITAAQFLQRFVGDTPWAHLDIAGTGMDSPKTEISQGWASGWGVRLLDRLVRDHYEA